MKKLVMALIIFILFSASVSAQAPNPFSLYVGGAISMPTSNAFNDNFKNGLHGSVGVGYKMMPGFQLIGKIEYHTFKFDFDNSALFDGVSGFSGGTNKMWMFGADGRYSFNLPSAPIQPYMLGGIGMAQVKQTEFDGPTSLSLSLFNEVVAQDQTEFYFNIGGGFDLKSGPAWSLFAQVRYVSIATGGEASTFIPLTVGLKFF